MAIPKKEVGFGVLACAVVLVLFCLLTQPRPFIRMPDGSVVKFDAVGTSHGPFAYDGNLRMRLRRHVPAKWLRLIGIRPFPFVNLFAPIGRHSEQQADITFDWTGLVDKNLVNPNATSTFVVLIDGDRSFINTGTGIGTEGPGQIIFNAYFENCTLRSDDIVLRLASGSETITNLQTVFGEMRVKNPIPKDKRF